jgi:hypothetical protein
MKAVLEHSSFQLSIIASEKIYLKLPASQAQ